MKKIMTILSCLLLSACSLTNDYPDFTKPMVIVQVYSQGERCLFTVEELNAEPLEQPACFYDMCDSHVVGDTIRLSMKELWRP